MRFDGKTTKRKITKWGLGELSSVKSGAQAPAKATILKTNGDDVDTALLAAGFTLDETLVVKSAIDVTGDISKQVETLAVQFGKNTSQDAADDGNIKPIVKLNGDTDMSDTQTPEQIQKNLDAANARVADLEVLAKMSDAEKTYMGKMSDEDKKKFMEMDVEGRKKAMGVAKAADESFTDTMGQTIVKSEVGDAAYGFMKSQNETITKMQEDTAQREALELVKSLCPNLPGEAGAMAGAIRKCKASLSTDEFSVLEKALKAGDTAMQARTVAKAHDKPVGAGDAQKAFNDGIAKIQSDKNITKSAAMQSSEGLELAKTLRKAQAEENE
ncbi:hypothetical protein NVP1118B_23 [Vibrio phage 1.118.B._10N.261.49.F6]|nr:hypothetical protein NVP1118A_23 [Vibrio phage 1.118.A._10N.261.49.F6]AUR88879.1 hypothetical protein NVP1118B_23 [Vibrio phage 1.118.B._10N.261.49.F6]